MNGATPKIPSAPPVAVVRATQAVQGHLARFARGMSPPAFAVLDLVMSRWISDALGAFTRLGLADALTAGPRDAAALARELELDRGATHRLLRALARSGLLTEHGGAFGLTRQTEVLRRDHPSSMRNMVLEVTAPRNGEVWAALDEAVRTGASAWARTHGDVTMWDYLDAHPEEHAIFHGAMRELTRESAPSLARAVDFGAFRDVCDLGGGSGELLATILALHPGLRGRLVDAEAVVAAAPAVLAEHGVADRCEIAPGDFMRGVPAGCHAYLAKNILHGLGDDLAVQLLSDIRGAMAADGRVVIVDVVVPEPTGPYLAYLDLQMLLVSGGGRERTRAELEALLARAGLALESVVATVTPMSVAVARQRVGGASAG
jgi:hypothetical protein